MSETENNYTFTNYKDTDHSMAIGPELAEKIQDFMYRQNAEAVRDADGHWEEDGLFDSLTRLMRVLKSLKCSLKRTLVMVIVHCSPCVYSATLLPKNKFTSGWMTS